MGGAGSRKVGSKASPAMNGTGNDSGVVLNRRWPSCQNAAGCVKFGTKPLHVAGLLTWLDVRSNDVPCRIAIGYGLSDIISDYTTQSAARCIAAPMSSDSQQQPMSRSIASRSWPSLSRSPYDGRRDIFSLCSQLWVCTIETSVTTIVDSTYDVKPKRRMQGYG